MMKFKEMINTVGFKIKKNSPEILLGLGIVSGIATTVLASHASTKVVGYLDEINENLAQVDKAVALGDTKAYTAEDEIKDRRIMKVQGAIKLVKLYSPAIATGVISIGCLLQSNRMLRSRLVAIGAAYATLDLGFRNYRDRVANKYGVDIEKEIRYGVKETITEEITLTKKGKEKIVSTSTKSVSGSEYSPYSKFFDQSNINWDKDADLNRMFLTGVENRANNLLRGRGYLFLNEVYTMLDIPLTKAGQAVGWVYKIGEQDSGDNYIDFGIYDSTNNKAMEFVNGYENVILLDFNVDGAILESDLLGAH